MIRRISLYIGQEGQAKPADLLDDTIVLLNWSNGDLTDPAQVKNSWSRQITLPGTRSNDIIFGLIGEHDRTTAHGGPDNGIYFDPTRRTPFVIYDEASTVVESGYLKLNEIVRDGAVHSYRVTLYGGLGGFLFNLAYNANGDKRTLADLVYKSRDGIAQDLDFTISKETVKEAWNFLAAHTGPHYLQDNRWDFINFAPAYNGYPAGVFDAEKAIADVTLTGIPASVDGYAPAIGTNDVLITFPGKKTEWETRDLRSYLQRPVLRFGAVLAAIADPDNNGGYDVELDETVFDPILTANPYVWRTWMTLPLLTTLDFHREAASIAFAVQVGQNTIPSVFGAASSFRIELAPKIAAGSGTRHLWCDASQGWTNWVQIQVSFYNGAGTLVRLQTFRFGPPLSDEPVQAQHITQRGDFDAAGNWTGAPAVIEWSNVDGIGNETYSRVDVAISSGGIAYGGHKPARPGYVWTDPLDESTAVAYTASLASSGSYNTSAVDGARSFVDVKAADLLRSSDTPADYLLSFVKMLGLRLLFDSATNTVTITDRGHYFHRGDTPVDLTRRINRSKTITTTPLTFDKRFYAFGLDYSRGAWAKYYANIFGRTYGTTRVDTGYNFNADTFDVMEGVVFRGVVQILESSKYFCRGLYGNRIVPGVFFDSGATYQMFSPSGEAKSFDLPFPTDIYDYANRSGYPFFDVNDKPQFHDEDNAPYDERGTLLFFEGMESDVGPDNDVPRDYRLTDDTADMMALNKQTPCWALTGGTDLDEIPHFTRYAEKNYANLYLASLDFGEPAEIPVPGLQLLPGGGSSIYRSRWASFISDRLDADTRVVRCWVNLDGFPVGPDLLRKFYYFDGAIWSLNKIINYSLTTWDDTECEFVKVQDAANYV